MDKKRVGAIVGVVGVAGVIAATQFMQIDASNADYVTKNLEAQYKESLKGMDQTNASTASQTETGKTPSSDKVFDPVQKVEYRISAPQKTAEKKAEDSETSAQQSLPEADKQDVAEEESSAKEASDRLSFLTVTPAATDQAVFPQESAKKERTSRQRRKLQRRFRKKKINRIRSFQAKLANLMLVLSLRMY